MAFFNEIGAARYNRVLQKVLQMKGGPPARQLATDIVANLNLDDFMALEHRILLSVRSFCYSKTVAAAATFLGGIRLRNPSTSNAIAVLEKVTYAVAAIDLPTLRRHTGSTDLANVDSGNESIRDLRMGPISGAIVASFSNNLASPPSGTQMWVGAVPANSTTDVMQYNNHEIVMAPGENIDIFSANVNQQMTCTFFWRERALEESEILSGV